MTSALLVYGGAKNVPAIAWKVYWEAKDPALMCPGPVALLGLLPNMIGKTIISDYLKLFSNSDDNGTSNHIERN